MNKIIILALLVATQSNSFNRNFFNGAHNIIDAMEKTFAHMEELNNAFKMGKQIKAAALSSKIDFNKDGATLTIMRVAPGEIEAQFDENRLTIKHSDFTVTFIKNINYPNMLTAKMSIEHKEGSSTDEQKSQSYYSSYQSETVQLHYPVDLEKTQITYDEEQQELLVIFLYKQNKQLPITIVKKGTTPKTEPSESNLEVQ